MVLGQEGWWVCEELDVLKDARDGIQNELKGLTSANGRIYKQLFDLRCPAFDQDAHTGRPIDELSARVDRIVMDMGSLWGDKWRLSHDEFENYR